MQPRIKKTPDGNQYFLTPTNMWVRNFTLEPTPFLDINRIIRQDDHFVFLENEVRNKQNKLTWIDKENFNMTNVVIVSDGFGFKDKQQILEKLPKDTTIIGVNGTLIKWSIETRSMNFYLTNNPYNECLRYLPRRNRPLPRCIASIRTNNKFMSAYRGIKYFYYPVNESNYKSLGDKEVLWQVDDYRNPIVAAINIAYKFGAEKILLFCCDDSFADQREGSEKLSNGLFQYPQQNIPHDLIDASFYWLKNHAYYNFELADHSSGQKYEHASYIEEEDILPFFNKVGEK